MRSAFATALIEGFNTSETFFLTGDLGFMALEGVREAFGERFINAGVAEQNMIGVAAGLARDGFMVFAYSIAPFIYARPFEQIRNDLCPQDLPVCLVGNGGGYAYGIMGRTHHALEDLGVLGALGVRTVAPAFNDDLPAVLGTITGTTYLRLGRQELPTAVPPPYAPWRRLLDGDRGAVAALGPLGGTAWRALADLSPALRPSVWAVCELLTPAPDAFLADVDGAPLFIFEEHVSPGGLGETLALALLEKGVHPSGLIHRYAKGYPAGGSGGSQAFYRAWCGLDAPSIRHLAAGER